MQSNSTRNSPRCNICGRPLTDPASIAAGVGPECGANGKAGKGARRVASKRARAEAYANGQRVTLGQTAAGTPVAYERDGELWTDPATGHTMSADQLEAYLNRHGLVTAGGDR